MRAFAVAGLCVVAACATGPKPAGSWSIDAEICCCDAICPCLVGSPSTRGICLGNRLVTIDHGHFGGVNLDGIQLVLTTTRDDNSIRYSVPAAAVDIELMRGEDGGPIKVQNLPSRFRDYVQYKSKTLTHTAADKSQSFQFSGTNGFCARYTASS